MILIYTIPYEQNRVYTSRGRDSLTASYVETTNGPQGSGGVGVGNMARGREREKRENSGPCVFAVSLRLELLCPAFMFPLTVPPPRDLGLRRGLLTLDVRFAHFSHALRGSSGLGGFFHRVEPVTRVFRRAIRSEVLEMLAWCVRFVCFDNCLRVPRPK